MLVGIDQPATRSADAADETAAVRVRTVNRVFMGCSGKGGL
jgi:hypothetical protein